MRVLIAGGGVAGLEAALALAALAEDRVEIELLSPGDRFVYRPLLVAEPFGTAEQLTIDIDAVAAEAGADHRTAALASVDPRGRRVTTGDGEVLGYEALLVATGASPVESLPGALSFAGEEERRRFAGLLEKLGRGGMRRLAFVVPRAVSWAIAGYELALLTAAERDARRLQGVELSLITHETAPMELFGADAARLVEARLADAGVSLRTAAIAERFEGGELRLEGGASLECDAVVALPALAVPALPGLPQQQGGFIHTDTGMQVVGMESVWAAGDVTWFPVKQGGLAAQQADVAARSIAVRAGAHVPLEPFTPVLRAALITGDLPQYMRSSTAERGSGVTASGRALWSPAAKLAGRYLAPYIARAHGAEAPVAELRDVPPPADPDVAESEYGRALALVLAAADADAAAGDYEDALRWLSLVERLNLVIPPDYVTRRHEWRRQLAPGLEPEAAVRRIDPSFADAATAISDLRRRIGWLGEIERRTGGEMRRHLEDLDQGFEELLAISRRRGVLQHGRAAPGQKT